MGKFEYRTYRDLHDNMELKASLTHSNGWWKVLFYPVKRKRIDGKFVSEQCLIGPNYGYSINLIKTGRRTEKGYRDCVTLINRIIPDHVPKFMKNGEWEAKVL